MDGTMKAVVAHDYGSAAVLAVEDIPVPRPGRGQIQVRVRAAALNPADLRSLSGVLAELAPREFPHVPGSDFAGTVTEVGAGVTRFAVGDEVFGAGLPRAAVDMATYFSSPPSLTTGTAAEYAVFEADTPALTHRPPTLAAERAAALPIVGLTALSLLREGRFQPGETVLVIGATGGVGSAVVPLLAAAKAHVVATAGAADEEHVRSLGAAEVIDHSATDVVAETSRRRPDGVDAVVNLALPGDRLTDVGRVIRHGGRLLNIAYPAPDPAAFERDDLTVHTVYGAAGPGDLDELAARANEGVLPSAISRRYRLDDGPRAYLDLEQEHTRGKLIVLMDT
ncbi:NADPH:quinone reductase [Actinobacteria bacterium OK074]|nr:NADPH:quinone reductase [Actinobacteria bacterium OK074]